ncbi:hypothetical protein NPX13_g10032 [Xylaria arbuscula]|uniref:SUN domain-containing protein n=1 Tax=Xylaria arbuscula TaxID=114810 RepID=A0A9W8N5A2_9PEZI|nr:hypothetical protein NPX13_g10032 [Xylaria arbuscula]
MPPKTKKKGGTPSPNLPSLFPTHDGSYGINTLISPDVNTKKTQKSQKRDTGIAQEQLDDNKWTRSTKGKAAKKYGMNSNLKKAMDESHEDIMHENVYDAQGNSPGASQSAPNDDSSVPKLTPHVPEYTYGNLPFPEERDNRPQPPYKPVGPLSADPYVNFGVHQTISPPTEYGPFYGMPQGKGTKEPISPTRPDTSRSFNLESGLFSRAGVRTSSQPSFSPGTTRMQKIAGQPIGVSGATPGIPSPQNSSEQSQGSEPFVSYALAVSRPLEDMEATPAESSKISPRSPVSKSQAESNVPSHVREPSKSKPLLDQAKKGQSTTKNWYASAPLLSSSSSSSEDETPNLPKVATTSSSSIKQGLSSNIYKGMLTPISDPKKQGQPTNVTKAKAVPATNNPIRPTPPSNATGSHNRNKANQREWVWPPCAFFITPLLLFFSLALALWVALPYISGADTPSIGRPHFDFGIGTIWQKVWDVLPEVPVIDTDSYRTPGSHSSPKPPGSAAANPEDIMTELKDRMPESIWVHGDKNGKIKISEDFWHALKELIEQDDNILSLKNSDISEGHWGAIKARVQQAGIEVGNSVSNVESLIERQISRTWEKWLGQNERALKTGGTGVALSKEEFSKLFQEEYASYQREISHELVELQKRISGISEKISKIPADIASSAGRAQTEITKIVETLVAKAISTAKLDAVAKGFIKGHVNDVLANQVNFFGIGAGVTIDPDLSSSAWKPPKNHYLSKAWLDRDGYKPQPRAAALHPWSEEGECFCAGPDRRGFGIGTNNLSMIMSRDIIPQHLVVEHILPGATLDPGAMPREIEVWVYIEEVTLRNAVQAFSEGQFPDTPKEEVLNDGFVKIGHFTYVNKTSGDGVQVFKISDEIATLGALTNRVVVRAISNYGADHTCFYRLSLYGEIVERPDDPPKGDYAQQKTGWF